MADKNLVDANVEPKTGLLKGLKAKLKVAIVGGAIVVAGAVGYNNCQLATGEVKVGGGIAAPVPAAGGAGGVEAPAGSGGGLD